MLELSDDRSNEKFCFNSRKEQAEYPTTLVNLLDQLEKIEDSTVFQ
jgi:hypothetical protein